MLITACPDPECGAPAEIILWTVAASTHGPLPRTHAVRQQAPLPPTGHVDPVLRHAPGNRPGPGLTRPARRR
jgi:hypothetical protein